MVFLLQQIILSPLLFFVNDEQIQQRASVHNLPRETTDIICLIPNHKKEAITCVLLRMEFCPEDTDTHF